MCMPPMQEGIIFRQDRPWLEDNKLFTRAFIHTDLAKTNNNNPATPYMYIYRSIYRYLLSSNY